MSTSTAVPPTFSSALGPILLAALMVGAPLPAVAQELSISGQVRDEVNANALSGAEVSLNDGDARVSTGSDGLFSITNLSPGVYTVHVVRFGYEEFALEGVEAGVGGAPIEITLIPAAVPLSEITVSPGTFSFGGRGPSARQTMSRADIDATNVFGYDYFRIQSTDGGFRFERDPEGGFFIVPSLGFSWAGFR